MGFLSENSKENYFGEFFMKFCQLACHKQLTLNCDSQELNLGFSELPWQTPMETEKLAGLLAAKLFLTEAKLAPNAVLIVPWDWVDLFS